MFIAPQGMKADALVDTRGADRRNRLEVRRYLHSRDHASRPDGQIDREAFAAVLESLIEARVHGIIVGGSTGEYYAQTPRSASISPPTPRT